MEDAGSVTLIFYSLSKEWKKEPFLNLVAAAAQFSSLTHVELAIGRAATQDGSMKDVARVFNDDVGVELVSRTGRNPLYKYLQIGCSKAQEQKMLAFARRVVGRPFSNVGMARSIFWPRTSDYKSFFCAELVAAILKEGGLLDQTSNPGAATPQSLHELYRQRAATTANPYVLRQQACTSKLTTNTIVSKRQYRPPEIERPLLRSAKPPPPVGGSFGARPPALHPLSDGHTQSSAFKSSLRVLNEGQMYARAPPIKLENFTMNSLFRT